MNATSISKQGSAVGGHNASLTSQTELSQSLFAEGYDVFKKYIPKDAKTFLEVGTGSGQYGLRIAAEHPELTVTLSDVDDLQLQAIEENIQKLGLKNVFTKKENALSLSFPDGTFDIVFSDALIEQLPQSQNAIKEMVRVLKPGGTLLLSAANSWNITQIISRISHKILGNTPTQYKRFFSPPQLRKMLSGRHVEMIAQDGYYLSYPPLESSLTSLNLLFRMWDVALKFIDVATLRSLSQTFGFMIVVATKKFAVKVKYSGIVHLPSFEDAKGGTLVTAEFSKTVPFDAKRVYIISDITARNAVRGGHAHKTLDQVIFCINGSFELRIDDGERYQKINMSKNGIGVRLGPRLWHTMRTFSKDCVILVFASDYYDENDYIRDYGEWKKYLSLHPEP